MATIGTYIEYTAKLIESIGVLIIGLGCIFFLGRHFFNIIIKNSTSFSKLRQDLGKVILLGLEILVAADIITTVSTEPTMNSVLILAVIVLVRTFLSFSLQVELDGKLPWQNKQVAEKLKQ